MLGGHGEGRVGAIAGPVIHKSVFSVLFLALAAQNDDHDDEEGEDEKQQYPDGLCRDWAGFTWNTDRTR